MTFHAVFLFSHSFQFFFVRFFHQYDILKAVEQAAAHVGVVSEVCEITLKMFYSDLKGFSMKRVFSLILAGLLLTGCGTVGTDPKESTVNGEESGFSNESLPAETQNGSEKGTDSLDFSVLAANSAHFSINRDMMTYFFRNIYSQYESMAIYYGLDTETSFKEQSCLLSEGGTWFSFFAEETMLYVSDVLSLCEAALAEGMELTALEQEAVQQKIEKLENDASLYGCNLNQLLYILFECDLTEDELRYCLELMQLAEKLAGGFGSRFESLSVSDYEEYYAEHAEDFSCVDILSFVVSKDDFVGLEETAAEEAAQSYIDRLSAASDETEYRGIAEEYIRTVLGKEGAEADEMLADLLVPGVYLYNISNEELGQWAFSAGKGNAKVFSYDGTVSDVLYLASDVYRDESATRNMRHILFSPEDYETDDALTAAAEAAYAEWEASGFAEDVFDRLCEELADDTADMNEGGYYENVIQGSMTEPLDTWLFDQGRVIGDHALIETEYGFHLVVYAGENGLTAWQADVRQAMISEAYEAMQEEYAETVVFYDEVIDSINA